MIETLKNRGVIVEGPVMGEGGLALAFFSDPDGNPLYLAETAAQAGADHRVVGTGRTLGI